MKVSMGKPFLQLDLNLERLRVAVDDLLVKLSRMFRQQKQQTIFLINNYDLVLSVLKVDRYTYMLLNFCNMLSSSLPFSYYL
jgi:hypothetical protein